MKQSNKKKRWRPHKRKQKAPPPHQSKDERILQLTQAFASVSIEEAAAAYTEANGDPNKAAEILLSSTDTMEIENVSTSSTTFSSSSGSLGSNSTSNSSLGFMESNGDENGAWGKSFRGMKPKKIVAATGMVSSFLGKDYVRSTPKKDSSTEKGFHDEPLSKGDADQFLCSMLGDECELSLAVVRDVLCQCGYDLDKALNVLLELCGSSCSNQRDFEDYAPSIESSHNVTDRAWVSTSLSSESECQENFCSLGNQRRNYAKALTGTQEHSSITSEVSVSKLPQKVLESLFNTPPKGGQHEPNSMNWRNVVKKMESLGQSNEFSPPIAAEIQPRTHEEEYRVYRETAKQHWDSMRSYYHKATTAYINGQKQYATYLSEQGKLQSKRAREADERASRDIFTSRNKSIENMITIDLHGQHIKQAMRLLKLHLLFGAYVRSVRFFKVITGCGSHGLGKSKLKESVTNLLKKEGVEWKEENRGTLLIRLDGQKEFSFLDTESDFD